MRSLWRVAVCSAASATGRLGSRQGLVAAYFISRTWHGWVRTMASHAISGEELDMGQVNTRASREKMGCDIDQVFQ